jgi:hypothetical protein
MAKTKVKDTTVIDEWKAANPQPIKTYNTTLEQISAEMRGHVIPQFNKHILAKGASTHLLLLSLLVISKD